MQFDSFTDFLVMGGHGPYVWAAYLAFFAVVLGSVLAARWQYQSIVTQQRRMARLEENRNQQRATQRGEQV